MENKNIYPLKYAELTITTKGRILEAGCGPGRILRHYKNLGYDITGIDYIPEIIEKLKKADSELKAEVGDITNLNFKDETFDYILAFGLYHNIENLDKAMKETYRVLKPKGRVCASFRADNLQTFLTEIIKKSHKRKFKKTELADIFRGFHIKIYCAENMPVLFKIPFFRKERIFNEHISRGRGYELSPLVDLIQKFCMRFFPEQMCNLFVVIADKI